MTLSELPEMLSGKDVNFFLADDCSSSLSIVPHFGHNAIPSSIFGFMRVSHFGQNFTGDYLLLFFNAAFNVLPISLMYSDAEIDAS